jgi:hypothetical protein
MHGSSSAVTGGGHFSYRLPVPAGSRLAAMRCAGPADMLEPKAWLLSDGGVGRRREGVVMAGVNGSDAGMAVAVLGTGIMGRRWPGTWLPRA